MDGDEDLFFHRFLMYARCGTYAVSLNVRLRSFTGRDRTPVRIQILNSSGTTLYHRQDMLSYQLLGQIAGCGSTSGNVDENFAVASVVGIARYV
jgi:hypothetical protein